MIYAILSAIAVFCAVRWMIHRVCNAALLLYMKEQGCPPPTAEDLTKHLRKAWLAMLHLK